ncbi:cytochrome ubiquinol oxidase subunit I [Lyticum sinuosum]|uniref:Cytochrome d ubiquinol oxidase subunit 1 n=1 Tax=Lyticum sinuosum TaxID=1332059 RepID=A0AAE4VL97_9RICK|nr:cytochrome ubiquinol oxidase subunit I [Lyticum sinuosum]MDZ5761504.1 Cytochrome d ubiquinol oxidase subunit 1 [Lyticum sinuosum]
MFTTLMLARIQFAFTVAFHIIFPSMSIGLALFLAIIEFLWLRTKNEIYFKLYHLWIKFFAIGFGLGVVSGVTLSYQLGTNWSLFSDHISNVIGPLIGFEVLTAFFLEASFLGVMLWGWNKVSPRMHFISTCIVAFGTALSAFWIISANSWMQTPSGYFIASDGRFFAKNWIDVIFNPSFRHRIVHMLLASYITTSMILGGVGAYYIWKNRHQQEGKFLLKFATIALSILSPLQILAGDAHGLNVLKHQPVKVAAMEGLWETKEGIPLILFAIPDEKNEVNHYEIGIDKLSSLILTRSWNGKVRGLKSWPKEERPPIHVVFWGFRIMVGIGFTIFFMMIINFIMMIKNKIGQSTFINKLWILMIPSGLIAIIAGWFVTEVGRQPYTVYGLLRTIDSASPQITAGQLSWSLSVFLLIYIILFILGIYYMAKIIHKGIVPDEKINQIRNIF